MTRQPVNALHQKEQEPPGCGTTLADDTTIVVLSRFAQADEELLRQLGLADVLAKKDAGPEALARKIHAVVTRILAARGRTTRLPTRGGDVGAAD